MSNVESGAKDPKAESNPSDSKSGFRQRLIKFGAIAGIIGTLLAALQPWAVEKLTLSQTKIIDGMPTYKIWKKTPIPLISSHYVFNVTNPIEFIQGEKIRVNQVGPFVME